MSDAQLTLLESDDLMHPNTGESNFNESAYYNFFDPRSRVGGFVRLGNRPNEGYAEMTTCFYLPDGRVGFMFKRPSITSNERHDAGGLRFDVHTPFVEHRITYGGQACLLANPLEMAEPRAAFAVDDPAGAQPLVIRFEEIWAGAEPGVGATVLGL